jgi:PleD family two-component response regulator
MVALPGVGLKQAGPVIDRIRADFQALPHPHEGGALHATFSAGLAAHPEVPNAARLTEVADSALLQAKRHGRNRVELARP